MKKRVVKIYDVTLRDGTQGEDIAFSIHDKIRIAQKLDDLGVHYIEGGWPGSNDRDEGFFEEAKKLSFRHSKVTSFGINTCFNNRWEKLGFTSKRSA